MSFAFILSVFCVRHSATGLLHVYRRSRLTTTANITYTFIPLWNLSCRYTCDICEEERTKFVFVFSHQKLFVLHIFLLLSRLLAVCTTFDSNENFVFMAGYRFFLFDRNGNEGQHIHEIRSTHSSKCNNSFHWLLTNEISSFCIIFNKREGMEERRGGNKITHIKICFLVFGIT